MITLKIVNYRLFEYERNYLEKEIKLFGGKIFGKISSGALINVSEITQAEANKLTYIQGTIHNNQLIPSLQFIRESCNGDKKGQSTRYGPHSLHEYKGRFNPQQPRSLLLRHFQDKASVVLDPFMGSGTTLIEARGLGYKSIGVELNQFAYLITQAKIFYEEIDNIPEIKINKYSTNYFRADVREYLTRWFPEKQLKYIESILAKLAKLEKKQQLILQVILSNLLREHSLQDPKDLRIRRRTNVPDDMDLLDNYYQSVSIHRKRHDLWVKIIGKNRTKVSTINED